MVPHPRDLLAQKDADMEKLSFLCDVTTKFPVKWPEKICNQWYMFHVFKGFEFAIGDSLSVEYTKSLTFYFRSSFPVTMKGHFLCKGI